LYGHTENLGSKAKAPLASFCREASCRGRAAPVPEAESLGNLIAGGGVVTYQVGGKQRVALANGLEDRIMGTHGKPAVVVFGL
jgi:hypothetical protein